MESLTDSEEKNKQKAKEQREKAQKSKQKTPTRRQSSRKSARSATRELKSSHSVRPSRENTVKIKDMNYKSSQDFGGSHQLAQDMKKKRDKSGEKRNSSYNRRGSKNDGWVKN